MVPPSLAGALFVAGLFFGLAGAALLACSVPGSSLAMFLGAPDPTPSGEAAFAWLIFYGTMAAVPLCAGAALGYSAVAPDRATLRFFVMALSAWLALNLYTFGVFTVFRGRRGTFSEADFRSFQERLQAEKTKAGFPDSAVKAARDRMRDVVVVELDASSVAPALRDWITKQVSGLPGEATILGDRGASAWEWNLDRQPPRQALFWTQLSWMGLQGGAGISYLASRILEGPESERIDALGALTKFGPAAKAAGAALRNCVDDPSLRIQIAAAEALSSIGDLPPGFWLEPKRNRLLLATLFADDAGRKEAARRLAAGGPAAVADLILLRRSLGSLSTVDWEPIAKRVQGAIVAFGPVAAAPLIVELSTSPAEREHFALETLGMLGPAAREALPEIRRLTLSSEDAEEALGALMKIAPEEALADLRRALRSDHESVRHEALKQVARMEPAPVAVVDELAGILRTPYVGSLQSASNDEKNKAADILRRIGRPAAPAIPALAAALRETKNPGLPEDAAAALRAIGTPEALAALQNGPR
jgi:HEAT repeat protein